VASLSDSITRSKFEHKSLNTLKEEFYIKTSKNVLQQQVFLVTIQYIDELDYYGSSLERIRPCQMSTEWWKDLYYSSCVVAIYGYSLELIRKCRYQQPYTTLLGKYLFFKLYVKLMKNLSLNEISYTQTKYVSSNSLCKIILIE
ncbi:unnamed protein product, partial [Rotaria sp. Silwood2]